MKNDASIPTVSVIVAIYNHFNWSRMILDALRLQTYKDFEVVIADDGSNELTVEAIADYCARHPEMRIIHSWRPTRVGARISVSIRREGCAGRVSCVYRRRLCAASPFYRGNFLRLRKRGRVFGGRRVDMSQPVSAYMESREIMSPSYFSTLRQEILKNVFSTPLSVTRRGFAALCASPSYSESRRI